VQAFADEPQDRPVGHPPVEHLHQVFSVHTVEEGHHVKLQNPVRLALIHRPGQSPHGIVGTAAGPKAVRAVQEVLLIDGLQHFAQCTLNHLVLGGRDADRPRPALILGNVHPSDRLMTISLRPRALVQAIQIALQLLPVLFLRDAVHPNRRIPA
jgi:hypothetical protein